MASSRLGTAMNRPITTSGRFVRLGTASMLSDGGAFVNLDKINVDKYAEKPAMCRVSPHMYVCALICMYVHFYTYY